MTHLELVPVPPVAQLAGVSQHYGKTVALNNITLDIPARCMVGLIGPDGVGKSSLLSLISGARVIEQGNVMVLGGDMRDPKHRRDVCPRIAWMPQGLGKNLYHTLSVYENVDFFARLFGHDKAEREVRINELLTSTGLAPFRDRPAGKLSGGMKQKLGLCCALIHDPELLILDAAPDLRIPATISFVASVAQFTPKTVETSDERLKLMFRVKARIPPELLQQHLEYVKTGLPGVAWVRVNEELPWPDDLVVRLPQ